MIIKYTIRENKLNAREDSHYIPKTLINGSLSDEKLIQNLCWGSTITPSDCKAVLENLERVIAENLSAGNSVNLGFISMKPSIRGTFAKAEEPFSKSKHRIKINFSASEKLVKKVTEAANPVRVLAPPPSPILLSFHNSSLESTREIGTSDMICIKGSNLKFDKADLNQGVFLMREDGTNIRVSEYSEISSRKILFKAPANLPIGEKIQVEVRAAFGSNLRTGKLNNSVEVIS